MLLLTLLNGFGTKAFITYHYAKKCTGHPNSDLLDTVKFG